MGPLLAPAPELGVEVGDIAEAARGKEAVPEEAQLALDPSLLVAPADGTGAGEEVVVAGELEQARMEFDGAPLAGEHRALEVVVEEHPRGALEVGEGLDVAAQEALERLVEREEHVDRARPGQHHDEGRQGAPGLADRDAAEVTPVDLGLLSDQGVEAEIRLGGRPRTQASHQAPRLGDRSPVAPGHDHLVQARGAELGVVLEGGAEEGDVGVELAGADLRAGVEAGGLEGGAHRVGVQPKLGRDGADAPVLGVEQAPDRGALGLGDHAPGSRRRPGAGPSEPAARGAFGPGEAQRAPTHGTVPKGNGRSMGQGLPGRGGEPGGRRGPGGRVIPHARDLPAAAPASRPLAVAVIQATLGAPAVTPARAAQAVPASEARAGGPAVDVAAIAGAADREEPLAARAVGQAARRVLAHRLPRTAGAAAPRKAPKTCDHPRRASVCRATTTGTRPPEDPEPFTPGPRFVWGSSLRDSERAGG